MSIPLFYHKQDRIATVLEVTFCYRCRDCPYNVQHCRRIGIEVNFKLQRFKWTWVLNTGSAMEITEVRGSTKTVDGQHQHKNVWVARLVPIPEKSSKNLDSQIWNLA
eukprot:3041956-Rhodomonas_salina.1